MFSALELPWVHIQSTLDPNFIIVILHPARGRCETTKNLRVLIDTVGPTTISGQPMVPTPSTWGPIVAQNLVSAPVSAAGGGSVGGPIAAGVPAVDA